MAEAFPIADFQKVFGRGCMLRLSHDFGGRELYIPAEASAKHKIAGSIGVKAMQWICERYPGGRLVVPLGPTSTYAQMLRRNAQVSTDPDVSAARASALLGVHVRTVHRIRANKRQTEAPDSGKLL